MASTLTDKQKINLFRILGVPFATRYHSINGLGAQHVRHNYDEAEVQAKTQILAFLDEMALDAEVEDELEDALDRFEAIKRTTTEVSGGAVGSLQGVSHSYDRERELITQEVLTLVPFYQWHEELRRRDGESLNIRVVQ